MESLAREPKGALPSTSPWAVSFRKGYLTDSSREAVETKLRPHLNATLASPLEDILPYKATAESFAKRLEELAHLPLWVAHYDLHDVNVLINEDCEATALFDWELSSPLPFGAGFGRICTLAGEFWMPNEFEVAERGFWTELFDGIPEHIRAMLERHLDLFQDVVILATLLSCFFYEDGKIGVGQVTLKALPDLMTCITYRIPFVRGQEQPYRE